MTGNMYEGKDTVNQLSGACGHHCIYCSTQTLKRIYPVVRVKYTGKYRLDEKALKKNLGSGHTWFVVGQNDLFEKGVPDEFITAIIDHTLKYPDNIYLFQTKNPERFGHYLTKLPANSQLGTTIESNREEYKLSDAPSVKERAEAMGNIYGYFKYVTVEPVADFDIVELIALINEAKPDKVYIGADSKGHKLPEPDANKVVNFIVQLREAGYEVEVKDNLKRILGGELFDDVRKESA